MDNAPISTTGKTFELVKNWVETHKAVEASEARTKALKERAKFATNQLGCWLSPDDARGNETFNVWFGSGILAVSQSMNGDGETEYSVSWRRKPDDKEARERGLV